jgi:hypothetical protein
MKIFRTIVIVLTCVVAQTSSAQNNQALGTPGAVLGIAVSPNKIPVYTATTITVSGFGQCGTVLISFGDGRDTTISSVNFPRSVMHTYSKTGAIVVGARPGMNCNATTPLTATLTVEGSSLDILCALTGCETTTGRTVACSQPTIKSVSFVTPLEPKEELVIFGCGFGGASTRGGQRVNFKGQFPSAGTVLALEVLSWTESSIKAKMPALSGVRDQTAWLQVANEIYSSNQWGVPFRATRTYQYLGATGVTIQCADLAYVDKCRGHSTLGGLHANLGLFSISGTDVFTVSLINGWVIDGWGPGLNTTWWSVSYPELLYVDRETSLPTYNFSGLAKGAASGVAKVSWKAGPNRYVDYGGWVRAIGPIGLYWY